MDPLFVHMLQKNSPALYFLGALFRLSFFDIPRRPFGTPLGDRGAILGPPKVPPRRPPSQDHGGGGVRAAWRLRCAAPLGGTACQITLGIFEFKSQMGSAHY